MRLRLLPGRLAVARLPGTSALPPWADGPGLVCIVRRGEVELSVTCLEARVPSDVRAERGWRAFEVEGPIDFQVVGLLHALSGPLARAGISLFAVATFDTDLLLVREEAVARAAEAFREAGHAVDA
ncbi:MAG TPA: ACT domain-containing protein [Myxococcaceae bacterium]|nr:ACT domain-containing protein [Myxococcaceae bacterium]